MARRDTNGAYRGPTVTADDPPTVDDGIPSKCLTFELTGDWGHFRRIDRTVTKQTYRVPPRTTLAGLLAAVVGVGRDGYYDIFADDTSAIAVELLSPPRTVSLPSLGLGTNPNETFSSSGGTGNKTVKVQYPDSTAARQLHSYHYLVEPAYRVSVAVEDPVFYGTLRDRLEEGVAYYPPTLGLSELHAAIGYEAKQTGEHAVERVASPDRCTVDSLVPNGVDAVIPDTEQSYAVERVPGTMTADETSRKTTSYVDYAFREDTGQLTVDASKVEVSKVDGRTLAFI
ncbi:type I-B CRISPR-associated protein Cas5 [Haloferax sp. Atlit-10N]|uniref:type I-B CRISPR-associated protein Cas5b n=1 Tax=unclassified Haloferax TaxID=2625095 RepID=UPI000E24E33C|nr:MULTISPECIES: type I-B CRISPR-associated protein Cas5b [unclassified Haloferax]RDZ39614.1 type I-B CRISPR-associated protein Cas5 [Haloferax sp. Atlit-16N]RDZ56013.1 type I-B CRISPR-associated protein Cas5 [Haloferax sp. Atlit-10N]